MPRPTDAVGQEIYDADRAHVFHSWSAQATLDPMVITDADGVYLTDSSGKRYLDFSSQLVYTNIGHNHPKVIAAIAKQAQTLCSIAPTHANAARSEAARLITDVAPDGMNKVFFTNGGTDAMEHAVRMARVHTGRYKTLSAYRSYHGATTASINLTGDPRRVASDYGNAGAVHFWGPFTYRSEFGARNDEDECRLALQHLERLITFEGPELFAAFVMETVPGTAGIMPPPPGYLAGVREICDRYGIVMILDEVMAGFGRCGTWLALDNYDVTPDLITFAKGVNSGYVPMGGVIISDAIAETFGAQPYPGGLTYSGHPLAMASAVANLTAMREEGVVDNARRIGDDVLGPGLAELEQRHPVIGDVRGLGVFWAVELVADRATRKPLAPYGGTSAEMKAIVSRAAENGLLLFQNFNRLHVVPPCSISDTEAKEGLAILDDALTAV